MNCKCRREITYSVLGVQDVAFATEITWLVSALRLGKNNFRFPGTHTRTRGLSCEYADTDDHVRSHAPVISGD